MKIVKVRKFQVLWPLLVALAFFWLVAACSSGLDAAGAAAGDGFMEPTGVPAATAAPPAPTATLAPTPTPGDATSSATPAVEAVVPADPEPSRAQEGFAAFEDLPLLEERAFEYLNELTNDVGVRTSGTDLEKEGAQYLVKRLEGLGYVPEIQEFSWDSPAATLDVSGEGMGSLDANILTGTGAGEATGHLVWVGLAKPEDIPAEGLGGNIALIERGEITFGDKVSRVRQAGALAAIIYNNERGNFRGTLGKMVGIPTISQSQADGIMLKELLDQGETVEATVAIEDNAVPSQNVIAELQGDGNGVVVVGAHYDTVPDSVGASDNSSGVAVLLAVAERLKDRTFPFTVRFVAFGAEETGLHGSDHYVDGLSAEELDAIGLMINLDSVGSGSRLVVSGDRWVARHLEATAAREDIPLDVSPRVSRGSDHANFRNAWVPTVFVRSDDLSRINSPADTMDLINPSLLGHATALTLDLLENVDTLAGYGH